VQLQQVGHAQVCALRKRQPSDDRLELGRDKGRHGRLGGLALVVVRDGEEEKLGLRAQVAQPHAALQQRSQLRQPVRRPLNQVSEAHLEREHVARGDGRGAVGVGVDTGVKQRKRGVRIHHQRHRTRTRAHCRAHH